MEADQVEWDEEGYCITQPAFQPNSGDVTQPWHWLAWTHEGLVYVTDWNEPEMIVEFYNRGEFGSFKFSNVLNFTMAAVTAGTAVFGSKRDPAQPVSLSSLFYRPCDKLMIDPVDPLAHWIVNMPNGEDITAVAVGSNWAAAATTKQYLRIYSNKAVQLSVLALPGPIVAMAGYKKHLALVYHRTSAVLNCQNLELRLLNIEKEVCEATVHLDLAAGRSLKWIGFSWQGMVMIKDSHGVLKALTQQFGWQWSTILDFSAVPKENGISEWWITSADYEEIRAVPIFDSNGQPTTFGIMKHPIPVAFTPQVAALQIKTSQSSDETYAEEFFLRHHLFVEHKKWANKYGYRMPFDGEAQDDLLNSLMFADAHLLKMLRIALKNRETARAWNYASLLYLPKSIVIAVKLAQMQSNHTLVDKLMDLLEERKQTAEEDRKKLTATEVQVEPLADMRPVFNTAAITSTHGLPGDTSSREETLDPRPAKKAKRASSRDHESQDTTKTVSVRTRKPVQREENVAAPASTFSFTSVRSETGAVSVRLANRSLNTAPAKTCGKENASHGVSNHNMPSSPPSFGVKQKPASSSTGTTKKKESTEKRELVQPRLNFAVKNQG